MRLYYKDHEWRMEFVNAKVGNMLMKGIEVAKLLSQNFKGRKQSWAHINNMLFLRSTMPFLREV